MYTLNTDDARKADQRGGMLNETGKYVGQFVRAEQVTTDKGTEGIDFTFAANDGRKCRFALYTAKKDGARIGIGHGFVMALMTCLKLREIKPQPTKVRKWDNELNREVDTEAPCFPELMGKPIGVLLEAEEYEKRDGSAGKRMVLAGVFEAATELTASELLDRRVKPEQLAKIVGTLRDRPLRAKKDGAPRQAPAGRSKAEAWEGGASDGMDDDIPF